MEKTTFGILWMMIWVSVAAAAALKSDRRPGHQFFRTLPENVQEDYLTFELGRGYMYETTENKRGRNLNVEVFPDALDIPKDLVQQFKALEVPDNFTRNLFNFVQTEFDLDQVEIRSLIIKRAICFENGECININDIGAICCPF